MPCPLGWIFIINITSIAHTHTVFTICALLRDSSMSDTAAYLLPCVITFPEILLFQTNGNSINILSDDGALSSTIMTCSSSYTKRWSINVHNAIFNAINALFIGHQYQQETSSSNTMLTLTTEDSILDKLLRNHQLLSSAHIHTGLLILMSSHFLHFCSMLDLSRVGRRADSE